MVSQALILTPLELNRITMGTLQYHFWQQSPPSDEALLEETALETIQHLHASGGPLRLNLPATLRHTEQLLSTSGQSDRRLAAAARQMIANYHRRLRDEWPRIIASAETLGLNIKLKQGWIQCEAVVDRLDKEDDGGLSAVKFVAHSGPIADLNESNAIEATMLHALIAAAYPSKRPVRVKYRWLYHDQDQILQLTERQYRENLAKMQERVQAWLGGEILARPGLHCEQCAFKHQGCPIYPEQSSGEDDLDLPEDALPATLSNRTWTFLKDEG